MSILSNDYDVQVPSIAKRFNIAIIDTKTKHHKKAQQWVERLNRVYKVNKDQLKIMLEQHFPQPNFNIQLHFSQKIEEEYQNLTFKVYPKDSYWPICTISLMLKYEYSEYYRK